MRTSIGFLISIVVPAFLIAGGMANSAVAQEKAAKATVKQNVIVENNRVRVYEVTYKPGAENTGVVASSSRVVRALNVLYRCPKCGVLPYQTLNEYKCGGLGPSRANFMSPTHCPKCGTRVR